MDLLRRAWHLARNDARTSFAQDPVRYSDFGFLLDEYLNALSESIRQHSYHPKQLLKIDVPKSSLSVRPGSIVAIDDAIVLFAIAQLIAPPLDKKLPTGVYSWRVKHGGAHRDLFHDHEILKLPFLKSRTIARRIEIVEPWYAAWPDFLEQMQYAYEEEGYRYLVTTDIVSYFENINLSLLRDLLLQELPKQPRIVNFLLTILEYWAWPSVYGVSIPRGIPQGNGVSSFLGNFYLLPLDRAFERSKLDVKYFRYVDDVKVLAKDQKAAREALFLLNNELRGLHLNIQSAKTEIHVDDDIRAELFDERLQKVNDVVEHVRKRSTLSTTSRRKAVSTLKLHLRPLARKGVVLRGSDLRVFRRAITAFTLLQDNGLISKVLAQLESNPDSRLMRSATNYLKTQHRTPRIGKWLLKMLKSEEGLFAFQESNFLLLLRYMKTIPDGSWPLAKKRLRAKTPHWYVRQQAALLLSQKILGKAELRAIRRLFENEQHCEVRKAMAEALTQLPPKEFTECVQIMVFASDPGIQRLGRFYHGLLFNRQKAINHAKALFHQFREDMLIDRLHEVEAIAKSSYPEVHKNLMTHLDKSVKSVRRPLLKSRLKSILTAHKQGEQ